MDQNISRQDEDELDLFTLFQTIWEGKWIVVICTAMVVAITSLFLFVKKPAYEGHLLIRTPSLDTMSSFEQINRFATNGKAIVSDGQIIGFEDNLLVEITPKEIIEVFVDEFNNYSALYEAIKQHSSDYAEFEGSGEERTLLLFRWTNDYELTKIVNKSAGEANTYQLSFVTRNIDETKQIIDLTLSKVSANTNLSLLRYLHSISDAAKQKSFDKISQLENEILSRKKILLIGHNQKIHFLTEQSTIARALNLKENMQNAGTLAMSDKASMAVFADAPYYLRGYEAIDRELEQLQTKDEKNIYFADEKYVELIEKLENQKTDLQYVEFDAAIKKLPLNKTDRLVRYNPLLIEFEVMTKRRLILALSLIFGVIAGAMFVLLRHGYRQHQAKVTS
ncbi:Wzz/FepE/Etk N-terminal domain-containing protein [uncultured Candidatus Puniceispirillum sp.]|uniref:Wzz/FepE/Etk N-terminal domain-containing protein n=1 Tax=uncultured Candidatus Puniceispirillum sp. TaxID=1985115 RepID=UPI0032B22EFB